MLIDTFSEICADKQYLPKVKYGYLTKPTAVDSSLTLVCNPGYKVKGQQPRECVLGANNMPEYTGNHRCACKYGQRDTRTFSVLGI